jgi:hypothetical protein
MADRKRAGYVLVAALGLATPARVTADAPSRLRLQHIVQETQGGCAGFPELDDRVEAQLKQLTGRQVDRVPATADNPTLLAAGSSPVFGGYVEPLDNGWWRARLWLKEARTAQVAVRDSVYQTADRLATELPLDAAALILLPDWSRTAPTLPRYCRGAVSAYPEDACDPFNPPPSCGVPFDCASGDVGPRCVTGPTCGVAGRPLCPPTEAQCRVRDWRLPTGITALLLGGVAVSVGVGLQVAAADGLPHPSDPLPGVVTSYVLGGVLLGTGAGLLGHFARHAKTVPCNQGN